MDWWYLLGGVATLIVLAGLAEEHVEYPDWLADVPVLRWSANLIVGATAGLLVSGGMMLAAVLWRTAASVVFWLLLVGGGLWLLAYGAVRLWELLQPEKKTSE